MVLFFFFMFTVTLSSCPTSLTPAASNIAKAYNENVLMITFTSIVFMVTYVPFTFVTIYSFNHFRPSVVFRVACLNAIFGGWVRLISAETDSFKPILTGFILISFSYPVMLSSVTLICNAWLNDRERTMWI